MAKGDRCENCWHVFENEDENICPICFKHRVMEDEKCDTVKYKTYKKPNDSRVYFMNGKPFCDNCNYAFKSQDENVCPICFKHRIMEEKTLKEEKHNTEEYKTYEYDTNEFNANNYDTYESDADKYEADSTTDLPPEHLTTYKKPGNSSALILGIMLIIIMSGIVVFCLSLFNSPHPSNSDEESSTNFNTYVDSHYTNNFHFDEPIDYKGIEYTFSDAYNIGKTFKGIKAEEGKTFIAIKFSAMNTITSDNALTTDFEYYDFANSVDFASSIDNNYDYSALLPKNVSKVYDLDFTSHDNIVLKNNDIFYGYYVIQVSESDSLIWFEFGLNILSINDSEPSKPMFINDFDIKELKIN